MKGAIEGAAIAWDSINGLATVAQKELGLGYYEAPQLSGVMHSLNAGMDVDELRARINPVGNFMLTSVDAQTAWNTGNSAAFADALSGMTLDAFGLIGGVGELADLGTMKIRGMDVPDFNIQIRGMEPGVFYSNPSPVKLTPFMAADDLTSFVGPMPNPMSGVVEFKVPPNATPQQIA